MGNIEQILNIELIGLIQRAVYKIRVAQAFKIVYSAVLIFAASGLAEGQDVIGEATETRDSKDCKVPHQSTLNRF